jgi:hypothetical protein
VPDAPRCPPCAELPQGAPESPGMTQDSRKPATANDAKLCYTLRPKLGSCPQSSDPCSDSRPSHLN